MGLIRKISSEFEERSKLFLVTLIISLVSVFLAYFLGGFIFAIAIVLPCLSIFLTVSKDVWSSDSGQTKVAIFSIAAILALVIGTIHPALAKTLLEPLYEIPLFKDFVFIITPSLPVMIIASLAIVVINFALRDRTAMNKHRSPLEKEFPAPEYKDRLKGFCRVLKDNLDRVEREGNWSAELFVPLDAEVEIRGVGEISKKKQDLLSALKKEKNVETFLVIGQPGSGKSVALRKLCRELLSEVKETGKVPVYINLKEWSTYVWSRDNPPTMDNFHEFVLQNIKNQGDRFTTDFLTVYFDRMVETGRLFFIFDSFDEIPALLENEDAEWLLDEISKIIHRYLTGGHLSRGILATRPYKRPSNQFISGATIHILPLSEQRISDVLAKYPSVSHDSIREILTTRRDLLPIAKNPFYCALIVNFLQDNNGQMPLNRAELFQSYIAGRLFDCRDRIEQNGLLNEEIEYACEQVAELMFNSERFGFEIPIRELKNDLVGIDEAALEKVIDVLVFSKIGRHSGSDKTLFTFSHKRFAEYFVVQTILGSYSPELLVDIHNDGKWRDVIVLLAELEDEERSSAIASYAWTKLVETHNLLIKSGRTYSLTTIHGLRFLRDAYLSRKQCIVNLQENLRIYVGILLKSAENLLEKKIAVECSGLLDEDAIDVTVLEAFRQNNNWLSETALKSCFYLNKISPRLGKSLLIYIDSFSLFSFFKEAKYLFFLLGLSPLFAIARKFLLIKTIDCLILASLYLCHAFYNPIVAILYLSFVFVFRVENPLKRTERFSAAEVMFLRGRTALIPLFANGAANIVDWILYPFDYKIYRVDIPWWLLLWTAFAVFPWYQIYYYLIRYSDYEEIILRAFKFQREELTTLPLTTGSQEFYVAQAQEYVDTFRIFESLTRYVKPVLIWLFILSAFLSIALLFPEHLRIYVYGFGVALVLSFYFLTFIQSYYHLFGDFIRNRNFHRNVKEPTRLEISNHFYSLKSEEGRLTFVTTLGLRGSVPGGEWPAKLPNVNNDKASIRLAQLEESWLNLDR